MPSMDSQNPSRRLRSLPTSHPSPLQASSGHSLPHNRRDSSGTHSGTFGGLGAARQPPRGQQPKPSQYVLGANEFAQNPGFNDVGRAVNAYATIWAGETQYVATGDVNSVHGPQSGQEDGHSLPQHAFTGYGVPVSSLSFSAASPQLLDTSSNDSYSPARSVASQLSRRSVGSGYGSPEDVPHVHGVSGHAHTAQIGQLGGPLHMPSVQNASPQSFGPQPPYGAYTPSVSGDQFSVGNVAHGIAGRSERPSAHRFASTGVVAAPTSQDAFDAAPHTQGGDHFGPEHTSWFPQTPQLSLHALQLSPQDSPVHHGGPLQPTQQPYGAMMPVRPPQPMGYQGFGDSPYPQLPLTHIDAANLGENLTLDMLSDSVIPGEKPNYPYPTLIRAAILGSPRKALTLQGIYKALEDRFEWFRTHRNDKGWQNSIRHNLSLNKLFRKLDKPITEPGKGSYWTVDLTAGEGNKRERKRIKRSGKAQQTRFAMGGDTALVSRQGEQSSSEEDDVRSVSTSQSLSPTPHFGRPIYEDQYINPALINSGHVVGGQNHMLPPRSPRLGSAPYAHTAYPVPTPVSMMQDLQSSAFDQFSVRPGQATAAFGNPPSAQQQFGQGPQGFDAWEVSLMGPPTWDMQPSAPPTFELLQPNEPAYHHGSLASSVQTRSFTAGSSSSSGSDVGSTRSVVGRAVPQVYRRDSGSSGSSSSRG